MGIGAVEWVEFPARDVEVSANFYESVFDWKVQRSEQMGGYISFEDASGTVKGGFNTTLQPTVDGPVLYITVVSIEAALDLLEEAGGKRVTERTLIGDEIGWWASFEDPAGNLMGVFQKV